VKVITVIDSAGRTRQFKADDFRVDDNGYLNLTAGSAIVAVFAPPTWHGVYHDEVST
jgi:hypothetical protein